MMDGGDWPGHMRVLRVVTSNEGKAREFAHALGGIPWRVERVMMRYEEIQADTLEEVAVASARELMASGEVPRPFILEDAGLFVEALKGFPGVYSAYVFRTLGCKGVLRLLEGAPDRSARFESRIALVTTWGEVELFPGTCRGSISKEERGERGFGFDPIFLPEGASRTFGELELGEKQRLSHRGAAVAGLRARLSHGTV